MKLFFCCYIFCIIFCTFHIAKGDTDAVLIPIPKDRTTLQYIAKLQQLTPTVPESLVLDLGGPFSWVDCSRGYKSSSYGAAECDLAPCASFGPEQTCGNCHSRPNPSPGCNNNTCSVTAVNPITGKSVSGEVASDILTVRSTDGSNPGSLVTAHTDFACGTTRLLKGLAKGAKGVVGFGRTRSSLLTQFDSEFSAEVFNFPLKFAICLPSSSTVSSGFAIFGKAKYVLAPGIDVSRSLQFTPMVQNLKADRSTDYYLNVTAIKINGNQLHLNTSLLSIDEQGNGGTKISTVHPYSVLKTSIFNTVTDAFTTQLKGVTRVKPFKPFRACYKSKGIRRTRAGPAVPVIDMIFHQESVYWRIFGANSMVQVSENVTCLRFVDGGANARTSTVIGGHQLEDNLLQFSVVDGIGFSSSLLSKQTSCANFNFTTTA